MTTDEAGGKPLPERILEWLKSQGYPLEMRVARDLRAAGFAVTQSDFYRDPHSSTTWREIDVSARYVRMNREGYGYRSVQYLVECKHPSRTPWILLAGGGGLAGPARVSQRIINSGSAQLLDRLAQRQDVQTCSIFELAQHRAYGIRTALSDRSSTQDVPYQAVMAAASAAVAAADEADTVSRDGYFVLHLTMPVVVTDAPLFMCWLDERGDLVVEDITEADLVWRHGISGQPHTIVRILHSSQVAAWAQSSVDGTRAFLAAVDAYFEEQAVGE